MIRIAHSTMQKAASRISKALRGLTGTADRPIARRNARKRVLAALTYTRNVMDREFPAIKKPRDGVKRSSHKVRIRRLKEAGWVEVDSHLAGNYARHGVRVQTVKWKETVHYQSGIINGVTQWRTRVEDNQELFVPGWAWAIAGLKPDENATRLRAAKKSRKAKQAALTVAALAEQESGE